MLGNTTPKCGLKFERTFPRRPQARFPIKHLDGLPMIGEHKMRAALHILLLVSLTGIAAAQASLRCAVCQFLITDKHFWFSGPALAEKQPVCETCAKIETRCSLCGLPVKDNSYKLADGRWLCRTDFNAGIFTQAEALRSYEETRRELQGILSGTGILPGANITVALADATQIKKLNQAFPSDHDDRSLLGLTRTRIFAERPPDRRYQHSIHLLSGLGPARLAAVCAHEYTHAWMHENVPVDRDLNHDTVEGFCELVAYKLMAARREEVEKKVILANAYTRGQVNAFVQAESSSRFLRIVDWIKTGVDASIGEGEGGSSIVERRPDPPPIVWPPPPVIPTAVPDRLVIKGISNTRGRRWVLINDCTLAPHEEGRVRLGSSNLVVRCLDIKDRSAVIQIKGSPTPTELFLSLGSD